MQRFDWLKLAIAIVISECAGVIGSIFTITAIPTWYATLAKPSFNPPSWLFAPVWTTLYVLMGVAAFLIWRKDKAATAGANRNAALTLFALQLALNALWSILFFGMHSPLFGLIGIIALWVAIAWTIMAFYKISHSAAWLLAPYLLWVSFAFCLNFAIWKLN
jgi:tryptophan-rich sensory protein